MAKRPDYAVGTSGKAFCDNCRKSRHVTAEEAWTPCNGAGPHRRVKCGFCFSSFTQWEPCMHRDPSNCEVARKKASST